MTGTANSEAQKQDTPPQGASEGMRRLLATHRSLSWLIAARFFSMAAGQMQSVAVAWHVYDKTHRQMALGYVGLATFLPAAGLSLIAGHVADRFDRKRVLLLSVLLQVLSALLLLWITQHKTLHVNWTYAVVFMVGCARAFAGPAAQALVPSLVTSEKLGTAIATSSSAAQLAMISGPALGGLVFGATHGGAAIYALCAFAFLLSVGFVAMIERVQTRTLREPATFSSLFDGIRYVWSRKLILGAISLDLFAVLLGGSVALLPVFARDILHVGPTGLGLMRCAPAVGAALMGVFVSYVPLKRNAGPAMFIAVFCFGLSTIAFAFSKWFVLSMILLIVLGAADMISVIVRQTVIQLATPEHMRGRVSAVGLVFIGASNELGELESGFTAEWLGTIPAVVVGGIGTCVIVLSWLKLFPSLRKADTLDAHSIESLK